MKSRGTLVFGLLSYFRLASNFITETEYLIGNKKYVERLEQPWFRVPHSDPQRVSIDEKDVEWSSFGKHTVPKGDNGILPYWTPLEEKYLHCLDRRCVCPFFNGSISGDDCILPRGELLRRALRQEIRTLTDFDRSQFEDTVNWMKVSGIYNRISRVHKYAGVHAGPAFTLWHREFLKRFELVIRHFSPNPNMGVPYWDSTLDSELPEPLDSLIFTDIFFGKVNEDGFVVSGPYANWTTMEGRPWIFRGFGLNKAGELLNNARVDWIVNNPDINMVLGSSRPLTSCPIKNPLDARMLEYSHDYVHFFIDGDMGKQHSSSNDVIFLFHHSMIDLIFESWRRNMQSRTERERDYPASNEKCFPPWHNIDSVMPMLQPLTNGEALSNAYTDELYEFAPRPSCNRTHPECGSKYLFCHVPEKSEAHCMAKVRLGGKCSGFEGTRICYVGECVQGKCEKHTILQKLHKQSDDIWTM
uniref:Tyrosinase_Cu-bd domain-containing protein n=1 Tax=Angiostrongylus cantonensis TaxID=6313 RepID=A0A158P795_ANGCA